MSSSMSSATRPIDRRGAFPGAGNALSRRDRKRRRARRPHRDDQDSPQRRRAARAARFRADRAACAISSRTRSAGWESSWGSRTHWSGGTRSPGPGLAVRCLGEVTAARLEILRQADAIFLEELTAAGLDR